MDSCVSRSLHAFVLPLVVAFGACDMSTAHLTGRATEEWTHSYPLSEGGEVRIGNTNGQVDVEGIDGSTVEIKMEKIARAATDVGARELLPRITIKEDATPDRVVVETARLGGILLGVSYEVRYHVRAPKNAVVNLTTTNGGIAVNGSGGKVVAHTTNGGVVGKSLTGGVEARSTNGAVNIEMASLGSSRISLRTTNGGVTLMLPESGKADVSASWTNGGISVSPDLKLDVTEHSRRSFEGRLNGGGALVELHTTNGGIRIRPRSAVNAEKDDEPHDRVRVPK